MVELSKLQILAIHKQIIHNFNMEVSLFLAGRNPSCVVKGLPCYSIC